MTTTDPYNAIITERIDLNEDLAVMRVRPDSEQTPPFEPGQVVSLGLIDPDQSVDPDSPRAGRSRGPKMIRRAYSIASPPGQHDYLEFYLVRIRGGSLTTLLWTMKPGDRLWMSEKIVGSFTLEGVPDDKTLVMVATGTGLAPFRSMYLAYRRTQRWKHFILLEGCRHVRDLGYRADFERYASEDPTLRYVSTITREDWPGRRGRVTELLDPARFQQVTGHALDPAQCHVFLCGNPDMVDDCEQLLLPQGFITRDRQHPDGNLHFERYW
ncbi:MAG: ferredoxin--NADP reductase [Phycisphaeraceae bacterium]|nr:ferredoxin--NADP reductase [Phycisphaeraceae bacterium]